MTGTWEKLKNTDHSTEYAVLLHATMGTDRKRRRLSEDGSGLEIYNDNMAEEGNNETKDRSTTQDQTQHRRTVFVRSLPPATSTETLLSHFSQSLPVKHATAVLDSTTQQCRGYGFVTFVDPEDARKAIEEFNGGDFEGRKIRVEIAERRHRDEEPKQANLARADTARSSWGAKGQQHDSDTKPPKLIIRNLPWSIKEPDQLAKLFMSYGKVKKAILPKKTDGALSGFGFVLLRGRKNSEKAITGLNGKDVEGRTIAVDWAVDKETWEHQNETQQDKLDTVNDGAVNSTNATNTSGHDTMESGSEEDPDRPITNESTNRASSEKDSEDDEPTAISIADDTRQLDNTSALFLRNLPFGCTDQDLFTHFSRFGRLRYARVVLDPITERSRGTGFVSFKNRTEATACLKSAPHYQNPQDPSNSPSDAQPSQSVLQNDLSDVSSNYTIDGRVVHVSRAVDKSEAQRLTSENQAHRSRQQQDKRRLYLLSEGTISSKSPLFTHLAPSELKLREASARQRQKLIETNPTLHLSLNRLSVRNIPRTITSKDLKALAREAVVGFATDVKESVRQPLSKEELERGGEEMREAERYRKMKGKGLVKQAKIVFEGRDGNKVGELSGAGRSRGYGFIEYYTHRSALMGLRWLNGHSVAYQAKKSQDKKLTKEDMQDRKKRLIVEFAIENVQVVGRRRDRELKARERAKSATQDSTLDGGTKVGNDSKTEENDRASLPKKRKRALDQEEKENGSTAGTRAENKTARRQQIIARKRSARKRRKTITKS